MTGPASATKHAPVAVLSGVPDQSSTEAHSPMSKSDAEKLDDALAEIQAHADDDLPEGRSPDLGGEVVPNTLTTRSVAEIRRLSGIGRTLVDERIASRSRRDNSGAA